MSYNEVILEGIVNKEPIFYTFNNKERMELRVETIDNHYISKNGEKKNIKVFHKVLVYGSFFVNNAKKENICKNCHILLRGKLSNAIDFTGVVPGVYCILISTSSHYLKITSNYFLTHKRSKVKDFMQNV